jgi:hypothetical protein
VVVAETSNDPTYHISPVYLRNQRTAPAWGTAPVACTPATSEVAISVDLPSPDKAALATDPVFSLLLPFRGGHVPAWEIALALVAQPLCPATSLGLVVAVPRRSPETSLVPVAVVPRRFLVTSPVQVVAILIGPASIPSPADPVQESISAWNAQATVPVVAQLRCPATSLGLDWGTVQAPAIDPVWVNAQVLVTDRALVIAPVSVTDPAPAIGPGWVTVQVSVTDQVQVTVPAPVTAQVLATGPALVIDLVRGGVEYSALATDPTGRTDPVNYQATSIVPSSVRQRIGPSSMGTSITTTSVTPSSTIAQAG